jgi:hypothetical protein
MLREESGGVGSHLKTECFLNFFVNTTHFDLASFFWLYNWEQFMPMSLWGEKGKEGQEKEKFERKR